MGAVKVTIAVASITLALDVCLGGVFAPQVDGLTVLFVVGSKLIQKTGHTQGRSVSIVEVGVCHFQAHIDDTQQNPFTRIGLWQASVFVDGWRINPFRGNVHQHLTTLVVLDALYLVVVSQRLQLADRYIGNINVANMCDGLAMVLVHHCLSVAIKANHRTNRFRQFDT